MRPLSDSLVAPGGAGEGELRVREVLEALPARQRRLLELVYVYGYSHAETAAMLGSSEGAVKTGVWRARAAFRRSYEGGEAALAAEGHAGEGAA